MSGRNLSLDYLKTGVIVWVVLHHAILAYMAWGGVPFDISHFLLNDWPVMDSVRWPALDIFADINDKFMMPLMFFVSGLFVWASLTRKGPLLFLRDRALRLGVPFIIATLFVTPLAYYPSLLMAGSDPGPSVFLEAFYTVQGWRPGPPWFIWVLLAFNLILVVLVALVPRVATVLSRTGAIAQEWPLVSCCIFVGVCALAYIGVLHAFRLDDNAWYGIPPFVAQVSRLPIYLIFFMVAVGIGLHGNRREVLAADGPLARHWAAWLVAGVLSFVSYQLVLGLSHGTSVAAVPLLYTVAFGLTRTLACIALSFGVLGFFLHFATHPVPILDRLTPNAFGIYLVHLPFVTWMQYVLLDAPLPAAVKAGCVFVVALALSWGVTAGLRRVPAFAPYL
jgi:hypothetical protein